MKYENLSDLFIVSALFKTYGVAPSSNAVPQTGTSSDSRIRVSCSETALYSVKHPIYSLNNLYTDCKYLYLKR